MRLARNTPLVLGPSSPNHRRHGRVRCTRLRCYFTEHDNMEAVVLDLSASGMRVCARKNPGAKLGGTLRTLLVTSTDQVELSAKVVWLKRRGFRRFEMGMTFGAPSEEFRLRLGKFMRSATNTYVIYDGDTV